MAKCVSRSHRTETDAYRKMILLTTVKHTGTQSLREMLGEVDLRHCDGDVWNDLGNYDEIYTTCRDPYRVAASWSNRGLLDGPDHLLERTWRRQWRYWAMIYPLAKVVPIEELTSRLNPHADVRGLHKALDEGDMETYFAHVPREELELALNLTREVHGAQFAEAYSK